MCTQGLQGLRQDEKWDDQTFKLLLVAKLHLYKQHRKNNFHVSALVLNV